MKIRVLVILSVIAILAAVAWGGRRIANLATLDSPPEIPTTPVKKGPVTIVVAARGELTPYVCLGDAFALLCLLHAAALVAATLAAAPGAQAPAATPPLPREAVAATKRRAA